jgi:hypothetical protein
MYARERRCAQDQLPRRRDWLLEKGNGVRLVADLPPSPIAPIEIRDFIYGKLIELSPVTLYPGTLIAGDKGLLARGLNECHIGNYGGLVASSRERDRIARLLLHEINHPFQGVAGSLRDIPGIWEDGQGLHLCKQKDYILPRLLIPVRDSSVRIQACKMRLPFGTKRELRYFWLSSSNLPHGTGSGSPLHFKFHLADLPRDARIVIVEVVLKADVLFAIRAELYIVATPCVTAYHDPLIELTHDRSFGIPFDQDHFSNETVCFHLASLVARRLQLERTLATTPIASWDVRVKGLEEGLLRRNRRGN